VAKPFYDLEELIVDAWPAAETLDYHGWLLRRSGGPSRRANSVASLSSTGGAPPLEQRIERAEAFYRECGQRALFQIGPCVQPKELDALLHARGYRREGEVAVMRAAPGEIPAPQAEFAVRIEKHEHDAWREIALHQSRFATQRETLRDLLRRLGSRVRYVTAYEGETPCASCYAIASEDRLGIYGMLTLPAARRRGAARAMLGALDRYAVREEVRDLYLLVEVDNHAARALYKQSGFAELYNYHYRAKELLSTDSAAAG